MLFRSMFILSGSIISVENRSLKNFIELLVSFSEGAYIEVNLYGCPSISKSKVESLPCTCILKFFTAIRPCWKAIRVPLQNEDYNIIIS